MVEIMTKLIQTYHTMQPYREFLVYLVDGTEVTIKRSPEASVHLVCDMVPTVSQKVQFGQILNTEFGLALPVLF